MSQLPFYSPAFDHRFSERDNSPAMSFASAASDSPGFSASDESDFSGFSHGAAMGSSLGITIPREYSRVRSLAPFRKPA